MIPPLGAATGEMSVPGGHLVIGVGIDVVAVDRFAETLRRTPSLARRLFAPDELITVSGSPRRPVSLAGRFAVKEAVAKALGVPRGMEWHDCTVRSEDSGRPVLVVTGTVQAAAAELGVTEWRLSLSHDAGIAAAVVLALGVSS
ncbi:holo-[acyl-carrier protein] synthase [Nakamurella panacisegetis]|uniref:Holo-[acyl-carrier-protein] synthase n=1 Tax=Nakamurella panacisegetis TaxID=1090615 RepID=A0A1H0P2M9_9ACTN|nr:holo-ACP synthase [Nakamurella panacisegetis]SDO99214.1 holo-[acyl-carrier protein] synthase [Nakamurella panacisegetis]